MGLKNFITFEGGECSGKTTVIKEIEKELNRLNISYISTREPGGIAIAEKIRSIILDVDNKAMTGECEALLYAASRMQHLSERVLPSLEEGKVVLCDRFLDSSLAYQGYARNLGMDAVLKANSFALDYLPDLTIFIDVTPDIALKRLSLRSEKVDRLDLEKQDFHYKVYDGYHKVLEMYKDRIVVVDGTKSLEEVVDDCKQIIFNYLGV